MDAAAGVGKPAYVDEDLRAKPGDLVTLMRAGRLSLDRVALAAFLGDPRAMATGVAAWTPPSAPYTVPHSPSYKVLRWGQLSRRARVWLAATLAEAEVNDPSAMTVLQIIKQWCRGEVYAGAVEDAANRLDSTDSWAAALVSASVVSEDEDAHEEFGFWAVCYPDAADWQAKAIAPVLLDPNWPPWTEAPSRDAR